MNHNKIRAGENANYLPETLSGGREWVLPMCKQCINNGRDLRLHLLRSVLFELIYVLIDGPYLHLVSVFDTLGRDMHAVVIWEL